MPFLDAARRAFTSAREFVRDCLGPIPPGTNRGLPGKAERELEQEINNDSARVVQGDGTECTTGREEMDSAIETSSGSDDSSTSESIRTPEEEPSWAQPWPASPVNGELEKFEAIVTCIPVTKEIRTSHRRNSTTTPRPVDSTRLSTPTRRRAPSCSNPTFPISSTKDPAPSRGSYRFSTITMSSSTAPAPKPSIRRSHSSHPDITTLCQQWAFSGPANQTLTYKQDSVVKRKHSLTFSSSGTANATSTTAVAASHGVSMPTRRHYIM